MSIPTEITESAKLAVEQERRRIVGMVLNAYALAKLAGADAIADALDKLANDIEHSS